MGLFNTLLIKLGIRRTQEEIAKHEAEMVKPNSDEEKVKDRLKSLGYLD
ncbi:MAG: hypothetical protein ABIH11_01455 [Candidatus Altiarchaeota archaeon]